MAQIIKHRRGSVDSISTATARKGELVMATGSIGALQSPILFIGNDDSAGGFSPVSKIYQGTTAPVLGGSFGSTINGTPFYSSDSQSLYILSNAGNNRLDLSGNLEGKDISNLTISGLTGSIAVFDSYVSASALNVTGNTQMIGTLGVNGSTTINNNLTVTGNTNVSGTTNLGSSVNITGATLINNNLTVTGNTNVSGTTNLGSSVNITGATLVNNNLTVTGDTNVSGTTNLGGSVNITGATLINNNLTVTGNTNVTGTTNLGGSVNVTGATLINNNLTVTGNTNVSGTTNISGALNVSGITSLSNSLNVTGSVYLSGSDINITGSNRVILTYDGDAGFLSDQTTTEVFSYHSDLNLVSYNNNVLISTDGNASGAINLNSIDVNVTGNTTFNDSVKITELTDNRLVIVGAGGLLEDSANLTFDGTTFNIGQGQFEVDNSTGNIRTSGSITMKGNITIGDNLTGDTINLNAEISSSLIPSGSNIFDLGSSTNYWKDLYVSGTGYINVLNANTISLSGITVFDDLVVSGSAYLGQGGGDKVIVSGSIYNDALTNTRVLFVGVNGEIKDNSGFTFNTGSGYLSAPIINATDDGNGTNFLVGNDMWIGDINIANTMIFKGQEDDREMKVILNNYSQNNFLQASYDDVTLQANGDLFLKSVSGTTIVDDNLDVTGNVAITGTTSISGKTTVNDDVDITGNVLITGTTSISGKTTVNDDVDITGNVLITGTTSISGKTTIDDDLDVTGNVAITGTTSISGKTTVDDNLDVTGNVAITGTTSISGKTTVDDDLDVTGNLKVTGTTSVTGTTTIYGKTTIDDDLDVANNVGITGSTTILGITTINNNLIVTGDTSVSGVTTLYDDLNVSGITDFKDSVNLVSGNSLNTNFIKDYNNGNLSIDSYGTLYLSSSNARTIQLEVANAESGSNHVVVDKNIGVKFDTWDYSSNVTHSVVLDNTGSLKLTNVDFKITTGSLTVNGNSTFENNLTVKGDMYVSGNFQVLGTGSIISLSGSQVDIGTNKIILNTYAPFERFAGIDVYDSGSNAGVTGSLIWDSQNNVWIYANPSGSAYASARFIAGPQNSGSLGDETGLTAGHIPVAQSDDHIMDSPLTYIGTTLALNTNKFTVDSGTGDTLINGNLTIQGVGGADSGSYSSYVVFRNDNDVIGFVSTSDSLAVTDRLLGYNATTGNLEFSSLIDGGTY